MKKFPREMLIMLLPICGLLAFGWWREQNPPAQPPAKPKFGITAQITKKTLYPVDVWAGRDTKVTTTYNWHGPLPPGKNFENGDWLHCLRLVARKNGRERTLFRKGIWNQWLPNPLILPTRMPLSTGDVNGHNGGSDQLNIALRSVPHEWGELWLCYDVGLRQKVTSSDMDIDIATVRWIKARGGAVWASTSVCLRRKDEIITLPKVSMNPQLELRDWRIKSGVSYRQLLLRFRDNGPLPNNKDDALVQLKDVSNWNIVNKKGSVLATTGDGIGRHLGPVSFDRQHGRRSYVAKLKIPLQLALNTQNLRMRGAISCDNRWPLMIDIPLLDRTEKTTAKSPAHR